MDVIQTIVENVDQNTAIVCNIGDACKELYSAADRDLNFYMLGSLGLASSIGFGIAVSMPEGNRGKTVVIDGDGGVLTNMGTLATMGRYRPKGFILVIADNGSYGSTGNQASATSANCDLAEASTACGIRNVDVATDRMGFNRKFADAYKRIEPSIIVARITRGNPVSKTVPLTGFQIRERFVRALKRRMRP